MKSPNIDALAKAGVRFDRAYCQYPLCNPSRTSMLTGRHPTTTGVLDNTHLSSATAHPDWVTLPQHFKANGYAALRTGKIFHGGIDDADVVDRGRRAADFEGSRPPKTVDPKQRAEQSDRIVVLEGDGETHGDYKTADRAIDYLQKYKDKPFFLACGFTKPHSPPTAPKKFFDLYDPAKIPLPPDFAAQADRCRTGFPKASMPDAERRPVHRPRRDRGRGPEDDPGLLGVACRGPTGTSAACSPSSTGSACATTRSSSSGATTATTSARRASGRSTARCSRSARACR